MRLNCMSFRAVQRSKKAGSRPSGKCLLLVFASSLCFGLQSDRITGAIDSAHMVALHKSVRPMAQPQDDRGAVELSFKLGYVTMLIVPSAAQQQTLTALLAQQQDPSSPNYRKWLTPQQYADRFGLSQNDLNKITAWLKSQGFQIRSTGAGRNTVVFSGTAAQIQKAFRTEIHHYTVNGENHVANSSPVMIPAALNGIVSGVMGLNDFRPKPMIRRSATAFRAARPNYTTTISGSTYYFLAPGDVATIYDINPLYDASTPINGSGQKLAVMGQTDIYLADLTDFRSGFNLPSFTCTTGTTGLITSCDTTYFEYVLYGTDPGAPNSIQDDLGEADLDVEWSGATAPNAQVIYVNAPDPSGNGVFDSITYAIENSLAPVISMSYGLCEADVTESLETILQQGNSEGITIISAAGDDGAAACDYSPPGTTSTYIPPPPYSPAVGGLAVNYPASSPEVTGIGGTSIPLADFTSSFWASSNGTTGGSALSTLVGQEISWNDDVEIAQYCQENPSNTFCTQGGSPPVSGWVPLTSTATAEQVQEDIWISIGGGGGSNCWTESNTGVCEAGFAQPTWQQSLSVPEAPTGVRWVPDVSLLASPNYPGLIVCTPQEEVVSGSSSTVSTCYPGGTTGIATAVDTYFSIFGGTSTATPIFAGMLTLFNQYFGGIRLGNINPTLYSLAATPSNGAFHQTISGDNNVYCQPGTPSRQPTTVQCPTTGVFGFSASNYDAATKYNLVTGLGSVDANNLAVAWAATLPSFSFTLTPSVSTLTVQPGQTANNTVNLTVASTNGFVVNSATVMPLTYSCTISPSVANGPTCSFSPQNGQNITTTTPSVAMLTIAPSAQLRPALGPGNGIFYAILLPGVFGAVLVAGSRRRGMCLLALMVLLGSSTLWLGSCGGSSSTPSSPGTPAGNYTVTINAATGGASPITASASFTLTVE